MMEKTYVNSKPTLRVVRETKGIDLSLLVLFFFIALLLITQTSNIGAKGCWYLAVLGCALFGLYYKKKAVCPAEMIFVGLYAISILLSLIANGNLSLSRVAFMFLSVPIAWLFLCKKVRSEYLLLATYINVAVVLFHFLRDGLSAQVYISSSTNFVSVYLLYPVLLYYAIAEREKNTIDIIPAIVVFGVSVLSRGRGGMVATLFLLAGVLWFWVFSKIKERKNRLWIFLFIVLIISAILVVLMVNWEYMVSHYSALEYFSSRGFRSLSRMQLWSAYFDHASANQSALLFGPFVEGIPVAREYDGTLHNSFLNMHAYSGWFVIIAIGYIVYAIVTGFRQKRYIYVLAFLVLLIRGFTDSIFFGTNGTPILLFFILFSFQDYIRGNREKNVLVFAAREREST